MNFIFRVDSSSEIGHGHLMRCLVLAQELKSLGASIHFICRAHTRSAHSLVVGRGYTLHLLSGKEVINKSVSHKDWLGCSQVEDAEASNKVIMSLPDRHVIVDHYGLDFEWESAIECDAITVIDDLADRHHKCTGVIDQSLVNKKDNYRALISGDFNFWGGASILLRDEFRNTPEWVDSCDNSLLLCMGGSDPQGVTCRIIEALRNRLKESQAQQLIKRLDVVVGPAFDPRFDLDLCLAELPLDVTVHHGHPNIAAIMASSNLSILSCGTMILEACGLGVPAIGVPIANNQKHTAGFLAAREAMLLLTVEENLEQNLMLHIERAFGDRMTLSALSQNAKSVVDKNAALLIAGALISGR